MLKYDWLFSYREVENIGRALEGLSRRLKVRNHLPKGLSELKSNYRQLERDFREFLPAVSSLAALFLNSF